MSYRLDITEQKMEQNFQKVAIEQVEKALTEIDSKELDDDKKVHQLRKRFKKIRALLRLFRKSFPDYKKENKFFKKLGKRLSALRDSETRIETAKILKEDFGNEVKLKVFRRVEDEMVDKKLGQILKFQKKEGDFRVIRELLESSLPRIRAWKLEEKGFSALKGGLMKTYNRARKNHKKLDSSSQTEDFHEWRKRAKYFRYQLKLLRNLWPEALNFERKAWHRLTDDLGDDHDLQVLAKSVQETKNLETKEKCLVINLMEQKQRGFRKKSFLLGNYLVAQKPKDKVNSFRKFWEASLLKGEAPDRVEESLKTSSTPDFIDQKPSDLRH